MKANKKIIIIVAALVIVVAAIGRIINIPILSGASNIILYPFEKGTSYVQQSVGGVFDYFKKKSSLLDENKRLQEENSKLKYENTVLSEYKAENENLKVLLDMKNRYSDYQGVGANIIARDYGNWSKVYTIDKGQVNKVKNNSVIIADGGLVGHIDEATAVSSKVLSILDSRSSVSAEVSRTGDVGILKGDIELAKSGYCKLEINEESEIMKGDQIITSYLSSVYPPGILIGTVVKVVSGNNNLVSYAYVEPVVDFEHLQDVLVINSSSESE